MGRARPGLLLAAWLCTGFGSSFAAAVEVGFPPFRQLTPEDAGASSQNYALAEDARGVLYLGNLSGVFSFDGEWWQRLEYPSSAMVGALAADATGRVAVGGVDEIGFFEPGFASKSRYRSVTAELPAGTPPLGFVVSAHALPQRGFAFLTESAFWIWQGHALVRVAELSPEPTPRCFRVGDEIYVWEAKGLFRLRDARLELVPGGERFAGRKIVVLLPLEAGGLLVGISGEPLSVWRFAARRGAARRSAARQEAAEGLAAEEPFDAQASAWAVNHGLSAGLRLTDGRIVLGSEQGGLLVLSAAGTTQRWIESSTGLPDDHVRALLEDREGGLWVALDAGLVRLELAAPLSVFDGRVGVKGSVLTLARANGTLWIGTTAGLLRLAERPGAGGTHAVPEPAFPAAVFALLPFEGELLVGTRGGVFVLGEGGARLVPGSEGHTVYSLRRSTVDPDAVWVGTRAGLGRARRLPSRAAAAGWRFEGIVAGSPRVVRGIIERGPRRLWLGTAFNFVVRADLPAAGAFAGTAAFIGAGEGEGTVSELDGRIVAMGDGDLRVIDEASGALVFDPALAALQVRGTAWVLVADRRGNVWFNTEPPSAILKRPDGSYDTVVRRPQGVSSKDIQALFADSDGTIWIGGDHGVVHWTGDVGATATLPAPILHRAVVGEVEVASESTSDALPLLPAHGRRLRVEVGPCSHRGAIQYQYRLEPLSAEWDAVRSEAFVEFTNLPPGDFSLRFRTVGPAGEVSPDSTWGFSVLPPWYRTSIAWAAWLSLLALSAVGFVRWRTRHLRGEALALESQVAAKSRELSRAAEALRLAQVDLERKNLELEATNSQLDELSQRDDLTGIANRRCLFQTLEREWARAARVGAQLSLVLLDLDHFKKLNDHFGHQAGDRCLRQVAELLSAETRRPGDLAARYGGEEFALLLPGTDLAGVLVLAERTRTAIEALGVQTEHAQGSPLTASFGVVSGVPEIGASLDRAIQAADSALYAAKAAGRNRVMAAASPSDFLRTS